MCQSDGGNATTASIDCWMHFSKFPCFD